jgi:hypothetical protein
MESKRTYGSRACSWYLPNYAFSLKLVPVLTAFMTMKYAFRFSSFVEFGYWLWQVNGGAERIVYLCVLMNRT